MNDPNGPIFYRGRYHMFFQYNPEAAVWGNMHWAHASSTDMLHWQHEPIALAPTPDGFDRDGVFSGSAVLDGDKPTLIYTGVLPPSGGHQATLRDGVHAWREVQCMAVAQDNDLHTWTKTPEPILDGPPQGLDITGFRDPLVWREGDFWLLILGSGFRGKGGAVLLYRSQDLRRWTYLHPLIEGAGSGEKTLNPVDNGEMWECPDFFPLGDKHVLLVSTMGKVFWRVGSYHDQRFSSEQEGIVDHGDYYAAKTMLDERGNRILWGWIPETRPESEYRTAGWAGAMALPRVLSLNSRNELQMQFLPSLQAICRQIKIKETSLGILDLAGQLRFDMKLASGQSLALHLSSQDGRTVTTIGFSADGGKKFLQIGDRTAPLPGDQTLRVQVFLDGSVLETIVNNSVALTTRIYSLPRGLLHIIQEGNAELANLQIFQVNPISPNRLTSPLCA